MSTSYLDWSLWGGGGLLLFIGVRLLIWALIGDRAMGRLRCPKCWGDMGGVEPVKGVWSCPKCEKQVVSRTKLQRSKKRWRWATVALIVIPVAIGVMMIPTALHRVHSAIDLALWVGGWTVLLLGTLLLAWSIVGDRAKGRKRCPKCWYDMASIEPADGGRTCPECGRVIARERGLFKARRRWRVAFASCLILLVGYASLLTPRVRERGWPAAVPTTVLVLGLPVIVHDLDLMTFEMTSSEDPRDRLYLELLRRLREDLLWVWQNRLVVRIALMEGLDSGPVSRRWYGQGGYYNLVRVCTSKGTLRSRSLEERLLRVVPFRFDTPETWLTGEPLFVWLSFLPLLETEQQPEPFRLTLTPDRRELTPLVVSSDELIQDIRTNRSSKIRYLSEELTSVGVIHAKGVVQFDVLVERLLPESHEWVTVYAEPDVFSVRFVDSIDEARTPVKSSSDDGLLTTHLKATIRLRSNRVHLSLRAPNWRWRRPLSMPPTNRTFAVRYEILADGEVVSSVSAWDVDVEEALDEFSYRGTGMGDLFLTDLSDGQLAYNREAEWTLRFIPDPILSLRRFDSILYWAGEVEIPIEIDPSVWEHLGARSSDDS